MERIESKGNLPKSLGALAKTFDRGKASTEFWKCSSPKEIENLAKERKCELATGEEPNGRYLLCGFEINEKSEDAPVSGKTKFITMTIYFCDLSLGDFKRYDKMLKKHKRQQEEAMIERRKGIIAEREKRGEKND